jgi:hypothetical protein
MRKRQRNPVVINSVLSLGKGEVACSNHAGSTILSLFFSMLRSYLAWLVICIYAGFTFFITF